MEKNIKKVIFGVILIVVATLLIMRGINPGFLSGVFGELGVWEIVWTVILGLILINGIVERNLFVIIASLAFMLFIYEGKFGIPAIPAWAIFVPAFLLFIGIEIVIPKRWHFYKEDENGNYKYRAEFNSKKHDDKEVDGMVVECNGDNVEVSFGSTVKYFDNLEFVSSKLECNFGSIKVYYNNVNMKGNVAYINAEENFGSIEIYVPKEWNCNIKRSQAFGSVREKGVSNPEGDKTIIINAEANFGEIVIHHV